MFFPSFSQFILLGFILFRCCLFWSSALILFSLLFSISAFCFTLWQITSTLSSNPVKFIFQLLCFHTQRHFYSWSIHFFGILVLSHACNNFFTYLSEGIDRQIQRKNCPICMGEGQGRESCSFSFSIVFGYFFILVFVFYIRSVIEMSGNIWLCAYRATLSISSFNFLFSPLFLQGVGNWSYFPENNLISSLKCKNLAARVLEAQ